MHWEDRKFGVSVPNFLQNVTVAIDTTTFKATYSGYKKKHTLKYEVACAIDTGIIVWAPVPGFFGPYADQDLLRFYKIFNKMDPNEKSWRWTLRK